MLPGRHYTPGQASVSALRRHMQRIGVGRAVIIQPSFYGTDNRCTLHAIEAMNGACRGIAVLDRSVSLNELRELDAGGMRGIRLNLESSGNRSVQTVLDDLTYWSRRLAPLGWHIQVYASFEVIGPLLQHLPALPVPVVIDHFAMAPAGVPETDSGWIALLRALGSGSVYVKLSAPYRIGTHTPEQALPLAARLLAANPDRLLWASDWPHTNRAPGKMPTEESPFRPISSDTLRQEIGCWLADDSVANKVLVENPGRLYFFS